MRMTLRTLRPWPCRRIWRFVIFAVANGTTKGLFSFQTAVPQRKLQRAGAMGGFTACHSFDHVRGRGSDTFLAKVFTQEITVHFHDIALPIIGRLGVMISTVSIRINTYRAAKHEKSSTTTFVEDIFDRMSLNAMLRRGCISSCRWSGEENEGKHGVRRHGNSPHPRGSRSL